MARTQKRTYRKRTPKRTSRKTYFSYRPRRFTERRPVSFKRTICTGTVTPSAATTGGFWQYFSYAFNAISNYTEYTALFDDYRINAIKVTMRPRYDGFSGNDTTDTTLPGVTNQGTTMVSIINDPKSTLTPSGTYTLTTYNSFMENGNVKVYRGTRPVSWYLKPHVTRTLGGTSSASRIASPWISTDNPSLAHFGTHVFFSDVNMTGVFNQAWDVYVTYYFQCKGQK